MPTWSDLEQRFNDLQAALRFARLDKQFGSDGESWRIAGIGNAIASTKFETLASIAGRKLSGASFSIPDDVAHAPDDKTRWFRMITSRPSFYRPGFVGHMTDDDGNTIGWMGTGSLNDPAGVSATVCLELIAMTHEEIAPSPSITIHQSGQGNRINLSSVDSSSNTTVANEQSVFAQIRSAVEQSLPASEQVEVLERLAELEASVSQPSFLARYQAFMQSVANHATVLAPFLPALASLLTK